MITRTNCVVCDRDDFGQLYTLQKFPIYMGTQTENEIPRFEDMIWVVCEHCGCVQLGSLVELDILYTKPHNPAIGNVWKEHNEAFVKFADCYLHGHVVELGAGNMNLANILLGGGHDIEQYYVSDFNIDKTKFPADKRIVRVGPDFLDWHISGIDTIIHSHTFEHLYNPKEYLRHMVKMLKPSGKMIFAMPYIERQLACQFTNALSFEHTILYTEEIIEKMLLECGFTIIESQTHNNFVRFYVCEKYWPSSSTHTFSNYDWKLFITFIQGQQDHTLDIMKRLKDCHDPIYVFGAHTFAQYMLYFGLDEAILSGVLDNDPAKQGEYLYGSNLKVYSPEILRDMPGLPHFILNAGQYTHEIEQGIRKINHNTICIT